MSLYSDVVFSDKKSIFMYVVTFVFTLILFKRLTIKLNIILAVILVVYELQKKHNYTGIIHEQHDTKIKYIMPRIESIKEYEDIVDFLFTIQDFYVYNPQAYEEMIDNIDSLFILYKEVRISNNNCTPLYNIMESKRKNAMNALHSIIYNLPPNKIQTNKLNKAILQLEYILNEYLNEVRTICKKIPKRNGYTNKYNIILEGPEPYNKHKALFSYDIL